MVDAVADLALVARPTVAELTLVTAEAELALVVAVAELALVAAVVELALVALMAERVLVAALQVFVSNCLCQMEHSLFRNVCCE